MTLQLSTMRHYTMFTTTGEDLDNDCTVKEYEDYNQKSIKLDIRLKLLMHRRRKKVAIIRRKQKYS